MRFTIDSKTAADFAGLSVDLAAVVRRHIPAPPTLSE